MKIIDAGKSQLLSALKKNKYLLIALAAGIILLLVPFGSLSSGEENLEIEETEQFCLTEQERRLAAQLGKIKGAGRVSVLLSVAGSGEKQLAQNGDETLVISSGSGNGEEVVELYYVNPEYTGAVIVCDGASSSSVRLEVILAVRAFTGLSTDSILVMQME
ncbi:MAG: stage III sporulation protein AG [Clostridia bacterium]|nr:stage III sporulation protein AG [Clostridia bacterium]